MYNLKILFSVTLFWNPTATVLTQRMRTENACDPGNGFESYGMYIGENGPIMNNSEAKTEIDQWKKKAGTEILMPLSEQY